MPDPKPVAIPLHVHGSSKHYYRLGCTHPLCMKAAADARNRAPSRKGRQATPSTLSREETFS